MSKKLATNECTEEPRRLEEEQTEGGKLASILYFYVGTQNYRQVEIENYVFTVNSFFPEPPSPSAAEKLCEVIKPKALRTLAKKNTTVLPSSSKAMQNAAGRR